MKKQATKVFHIRKVKIISDLSRYTCHVKNILYKKFAHITQHIGPEVHKKGYTWKPFRIFITRFWGSSSAAVTSVIVSGVSIYLILWETRNLYNVYSNFDFSTTNTKQATTLNTKWWPKTMTDSGQRWQQRVKYLSLSTSNIEEDDSQHCTDHRIHIT